jgi:putative glutamine amidotransferase
MKRKPIIGITLDSAKDSDKTKYSLFPWYALRQNYCDSVIKAGGIPILLPYNHEAIDDMLGVIDGLIMPGGDEDINPKFYNQQILSDKVKVNDQRANFEFKLLKEALSRDIPFLGICGGMQMLNVVCGGDLIQHIPDYIESEINHEQPHPKDIPSHSINIKLDTLLARIANSYEWMVNSTHHQAVCSVGQGLIVSATASDNIIEAIESQNHRFVVGVEWHPEYLNTELDLNLFKNLILSAQE